MAAQDEASILVISTGADVNAVGPLQMASSRGLHNVVRILLDEGADINAVDEIGTALMAAAQGGHNQAEQVVELLLDRGAHIDAVGGEYGTALEAARRTGHESIVKLLLQRGADVNAHNCYIRRLAAEKREETIRFLGAWTFPSNSSMYGAPSDFGDTEDDDQLQDRE